MAPWNGEILDYNNQNAVPEHHRHARLWLENSTYVRKHMECSTDIPYGPHPRERLDVFPAPVEGAPVLVFIHGGWFQFLDKASLSFMAPPFVQQGITVVTISYPLTPQATIGDIIDSAARAMLWVKDNITRFGGDPARIFVAGHSAGGHLALTMGLRDWTADAGEAALVKGCFPISGLYDLAPVIGTDYNAAIRLDAQSARQWSPLANPSSPSAHLMAILGGDEIAGFQWQHRALLDFCKARRISAHEAVAPGRNHYTIVDEFCTARSPLFLSVVHTIKYQ